jgi:hypothetical protein
MGLAYALMMQDDKDYQGQDDSVRDNNWITPVGKFPVAKELAFIYKTIPERIVNYMHRMGTPEEQSALDALGGLTKAGLSAYSSPTAIPNAIKPVLENLTNYSFFKQGELVPTSQQKIEAGYQTVPGTSELAKAIGKLSTNGPVQISPIQLDNVINGMFGMAGATTLQMTDALLNPTRADRPVYKLPFASIFTYDKIGNRATSEFYDLEHKVQTAKSTYDALKQKDPEAADAYGDKHAALIELAPKLTPVLKRLNDTRKLIAMLEAGDEAIVGKMTGAQLREEIDALRKDMNESLDFVREVSNNLNKE